jgi:diaminobutyrate-2-oxoglutarate transaminase
VRGRGLIQAIVFAEPGLAEEISQAAFERGLIIETCGPRDEALKLLPPLTITREELDRGIAILRESLDAVQKAGQQRALAQTS